MLKAPLDSPPRRRERRGRHSAFISARSVPLRRHGPSEPVHRPRRAVLTTWAPRRGCLLAVACSAGLARDGLHRGRELTDGELVDVDFRAGIVNVDSNEVAVSVVVKHHSLGNLPAFDARSLRKVDVQRIRFRIVVQFHGLNRRSGNALWMVTWPSSVMTLKKRPSSSGASAQKAITIAPLGLRPNRFLYDPDAPLLHPLTTGGRVGHVRDQPHQIVPIQDTSMTPMRFEFLCLVADGAEVGGDFQGRFRKLLGWHISPVIELQGEQHLESPPRAAHRLSFP